MSDGHLARALLLLALTLGVVAESGPAAAAVDRTPPTTPTNLHATSSAPTSVSMQWTGSTDNASTPTYVVKLLNTGATRSTGTATATTWTGLAQNTTYRFVVYARDAAGNQSGNSNTLTATTPSNAVPAVPANLHVTGTTTGSVSLAWNAVPNTVSYQLMVETTLRLPVTTTSDTADGLMPGTIYAFRVRALNSVGQSAWSAPVPGTTLADAEAPTAPVATGTAVGPSRIQLSWTASTDNLGYVGYNVYLDGRPAHNMLPLDSTGRLVELQDLRAASTHELSVRAYDRSGNLSAPSTLTLTTLPGTETVPPAAPANLRADWTQPSYVRLRWDPAADNVETTAYEIYVDGAFAGENLQDVFYPGFLLNTFEVRHLAPGTTHVFTVRARDESGNLSAPSAPLTIALPPSTDTTPPSTPVVTYGDTWPGCSFIDLRWNPSSDDSGGQLEYEIYEDGAFMAVDTGEVPEASFGRHTYAVRAVDPSGNSSPLSNSIVLDLGNTC